MTTKGSIPHDFMQRLPSAAAYYASALPDLSEPDETGWASARCPFGRNRNGHQVRVDLRLGSYRCKVCGGGDLILFHMLRTGHGFKASVLELIGDDHADR